MVLFIVRNEKVFKLYEKVKELLKEFKNLERMLKIKKRNVEQQPI